ncbi:MAG: M20 family metallopeptidase [Nitrospinota bacterium]
MSQLKRELCRRVEAQGKELWAACRRIHGEPELGFQEFKASALLQELLSEGGFRVKVGLKGLDTAFQAEFSGDGPSVALIAEYDALPGLGHACGHNIIGLASVGAARALAALGSHWQGRLLVLGTPAEEGGGGKVILAQRGAFRGIDAAMMVHPSNETRCLVSFLAMRELRFSFRGRAAHAAAAPHRGLNALDAVILTFNNINALRQQVRSDVRIHGVITQGGRAPNIIPEEAAAWFYVRAADDGYLRELEQRVIACARGAARATGTRLRIKRGERPMASMKPNRSLAELFRKNLLRLGIKEQPTRGPGEIGSSDIGNVSQLVPTIHPNLALVPPEVAGHTREFERAAASLRGRRCLLTAAKALAMTAADLFLDGRAMRAVCSEFKERA